MKKKNKFGDDTLSIHAGQKPDVEFGARAQPIYWTSSFVFDDTDSAASLFNMERAGHVYSRISNPTVSSLEERIASLESGVGSIVTSSGQSSLHLAISTLMNAGSHIVASSSLYGGSHNLLKYTLPRFGINTTFIDSNKPEDFKKAIKKNTRLIFTETVANPQLKVADIPSLAEIANESNIPLLVDSTLTSSYLINPIKYGASLVMHSLTKFMSGHGTAMGGVIIDSGDFDWNLSKKFPTLTEPYEGFHNMVFTEESTNAAFLLRARREGLRDFGACISPMNAFLILQGIETLNIRMEKHISNTNDILSFLSKNEFVKEVIHPSLDNHPDYNLSKKLYSKGTSSIINFSLKGGFDSGKKFIDSLSLFSHLANIGDAKSLVIHPASTTHFRMSKKELKDSGLSEGTIRLSIGLENSSDLIDDLKFSLKKSHQSK